MEQTTFCYTLLALSVLLLLVSLKNESFGVIGSKNPSIKKNK